MMPIKRLYDITCEVCGNAFISGQVKAKWCDDTCRKEGTKILADERAKKKAKDPEQIAKRQDAAGTKKKGRKFDSDFNNDWIMKAL